MPKLNDDFTIADCRHLFLDEVAAILEANITRSVNTNPPPLTENEKLHLIHLVHQLAGREAAIKERGI